MGVLEGLFTTLHLGLAGPSVGIDELIVLDRRTAPVGDRDLQAFVEEGHLSKPSGQGLIGVIGGLKNGGAGEEGHDGAGLLARLQLLQGSVRIAQTEGLPPVIAVTVHVDGQLVRERVHHRDTHAVQTTGHLVAAVAELAAGMQHRQCHRERGDLLFRVLLHRDASTVVGHPHAVPVDQLDENRIAVAGQGFVHGVVDDLVHQVMKTAFAGGTDVHARALSDGLQALEDRDGRRVVIPGVDMGCFGC